MTNQPIIQVLASATFKRNLRTLAKKYRSIRDDIQPMIEQLEQGELPGDQIPSIGYTVFKLSFFVVVNLNCCLSIHKHFLMESSEFVTFFGNS